MFLEKFLFFRDCAGACGLNIALTIKEEQVWTWVDKGFQTELMITTCNLQGWWNEIRTYMRAKIYIRLFQYSHTSITFLGRCSEQRWNIMAKNHSNCSKHSSFSQCVPEELELEVLVLKNNPKAEYTRLTTRCVYQRTRQPTTQPVMELLEGMLRWGRRAGFVCFLVFFVFGLSCVGGDAKVRKNRLTPALIECSRALKLP